MEKEEPNLQENPPPLSEFHVHNSTAGTSKEESLIRKPAPNISPTTATATSCGGDRLKRDEWSEGAVSSLLDAYESKWILRNRAKLKGHDWEDVARFVSSRANSTRSPKTQTQCKNKIESMKKRYRSESAATDPSSWPLFQRLDLLLRCRTHPVSSSAHPLPSNTALQQSSIVLLDQLPIPSLVPPPALFPPAILPPPLPSPLATGVRLESHESNDVQHIGKQDEDTGALGGRNFDNANGGSDKISMEIGSSTPISDTVKEKLKMKKVKMESKSKMKKKKRCRGEYWEVAESIRWLGEVVMKSEQARMETMKEIERMRVEAEAKRGEMDLKRTEIIANTQLQIAKLLASNNGKDIDSSLRIGRS